MLGTHSNSLLIQTFDWITLEISTSCSNRWIAQCSQKSECKVWNNVFKFFYIPSSWSIGVSINLAYLDEWKPVVSIDIDAFQLGLQVGLFHVTRSRSFLKGLVHVAMLNQHIKFSYTQQPFTIFFLMHLVYADMNI